MCLSNPCLTATVSSHHCWQPCLRHPCLHPPGLYPEYWSVIHSLPQLLSCVRGLSVIYLISYSRCAITDRYFTLSLKVRHHEHNSQLLWRSCWNGLCSVEWQRRAINQSIFKLLWHFAKLCLWSYIPVQPVKRKTDRPTLTTCRIPWQDLHNNSIFFKVIEAQL